MKIKIYQEKRFQKIQKAFETIGFAKVATSANQAKNLAALSFAISIKWFIPIPQKNDNLGANSSILRPASIPFFTYSNPFASVQASSTDLKKYNIELGKTYPYPMIDHSEARDRALMLYKKLK